jgi:hypothetical protein
MVDPDPENGVICYLHRTGGERGRLTSAVERWAVLPDGAWVCAPFSDITAIHRARVPRVTIQVVKSTHDELAPKADELVAQRLQVTVAELNRKMLDVGPLARRNGVGAA